GDGAPEGLKRCFRPALLHFSYLCLSKIKGLPVQVSLNPAIVGFYFLPEPAVSRVHPDLRRRHHYSTRITGLSLDWLFLNLLLFTSQEGGPAVRRIDCPGCLNVFSYELYLLRPLECAGPATV